MTPLQRASAKEFAEMQKARNLLARGNISANKLLDELEQIKEQLQTCELPDIQRLTAIAGINFQLLKKVMPDLKPVEMEHGEKETTVIHIDKSQYAEARRMMLEKDDI